jgi:hypothetical protein
MESNPPCPSFSKGGEKDSPFAKREYSTTYQKKDNKISPFEKGGLRGILINLFTLTKVYPSHIP